MDKAVSNSALEFKQEDLGDPIHVCLIEHRNADVIWDMLAHMKDSPHLRPLFKQTTRETESFEQIERQLLATVNFLRGKKRVPIDFRSLAFDGMVNNLITALHGVVEDFKTSFPPGTEEHRAAVVFMREYENHYKHMLRRYLSCREGKIGCHVCQQRSSERRKVVQCSSCLLYFHHDCGGLILQRTPGWTCGRCSVEQDVVYGQGNHHYQHAAAGRQLQERVLPDSGLSEDTSSRPDSKATDQPSTRTSAKLKRIRGQMKALFDEIVVDGEEFRKKQATSFKRQIARLQTKLKKAEAKALKEAVNAERSAAALEKVLSNTKNVKENLKKLSKTLEKKNNENVKLGKELDNVKKFHEKELLRLQEELRASKAVNRELENELHSTKTKITDSAADLKSLTEKLNACEKDLESSHNEMRDLKNKNLELKKQLEIQPPKVSESNCESQKKLSDIADTDDRLTSSAGPDDGKAEMGTGPEEKDCNIGEIGVRTNGAPKSNSIEKGNSPESPSLCDGEIVMGPESERKLEESSGCEERKTRTSRNRARGNGACKKGTRNYESGDSFHADSQHLPIEKILPYAHCVQMYNAGIIPRKTKRRRSVPMRWSPEDYVEKREKNSLIENAFRESISRKEHSRGGSRTQNSAQRKKRLRTEKLPEESVQSHHDREKSPVSPVPNKESPVSEEEFEVEEIVDMKTGDDGKVQYRVRWKGFTLDDDTWESEANMNCPLKIKYFLSRRKHPQQTEWKMSCDTL